MCGDPARIDAHRVCFCCFPKVRTSLWLQGYDICKDKMLGDRERSLGQAIFGASVTKCVGTRGLKILGSKSYNSWSGKCRVPEAVVTKMSLYEIDLLIPTAPLKILLLCEKPLQILSPTSPTPTYSPPTNSSLYPALVLLIFWIYFMMTFAHGNTEEAAVGCTVPFLSWVFIF